MSQTLYRRPLPSEAIAFSSLDGRKIFAEAQRSERAVREAVALQAIYHLSGLKALFVSARGVFR